MEVLRLVLPLLNIKMKYYLAIIFGIWTTVMVAQTTFVYVDVSRTDDRDYIGQELLKYTKMPNDSFLFFISNDRQPIIGDNINDFANKLKELNSIKPSNPITYVEVDTINSIIFTENKALTFCFYLNKDLALNGQIKYLVDRILLCNNLSNGKGINKNVEVKLYFTTNESLSENELNELLKYEPYQIFTY